MLTNMGMWSLPARPGSQQQFRRHHFTSAADPTQQDPNSVPAAFIPRPFGSESVLCCAVLSLSVSLLNFHCALPCTEPVCKTLTFMTTCACICVWLFRRRTSSTVCSASWSSSPTATRHSRQNWSSGGSQCGSWAWRQMSCHQSECC